MELELTPMEAYVIFNAIEARHQYVSDDFEAPQEELPHLQSAYDKFMALKIDVKINPSKTQANPEDLSANKDFKQGDKPKVCRYCSKSMSEAEFNIHYCRGRVEAENIGKPS